MEMTQLHVRFLHLILCFHLFLPPYFLILPLAGGDTNHPQEYMYTLDVAILEIKTFNSQGFQCFFLSSSALNPIFGAE